MTLRICRALFAVIAIGCAYPATALTIDGTIPLPVVVADDALPAERTAANELATYLGRVLQAEFPLRREADHDADRPALFVGPTRFARASGIDFAALGPEEWILRTSGGSLVLSGGRPRGTLYAVYRFLEDHLGIRWWTPFDETVPHRKRLRVPSLDARGSPALGHRDINRIEGRRAFCARNRLNGHATWLGPDHGERLAFGRPFMVHTFYLYVPLEEWFDAHPEYFSEIAGMRFRGEGQLCLTNDALRELVVSRLEAYIERSAREAEKRGEAPPRIFDLSQNDWAKPCACDRCSAFVAREGESGLVVDFVNAVADAIRSRHPDVRLATLAYAYTIDPPATVRPRDNVIVRFAGLYGRDFGKAVTHPANAAYRKALEGWSRIAPHLWVWDYSVTFGEPPESPLPNFLHFAEEYRWYRDLGIEGAYVQFNYPIRADLGDLKLWLLAKTLEDPDRSPRMLVREFTRGFYGPAARHLRRYISLLRSEALRHPSRIEFHSGPEDYAHLTPEFFERAHRRFDAAARSVRDDPVLSRRVRQARMSLDLATLARSGAPDLEIIERYRRAGDVRGASTYPERLWDEKKSELDDALEEALAD